MKITGRRILDVLAVACAMGGGTLVATNLGPAYAVTGYCLFLISAISGTAILKMSNGATSLIIVNLYFMLTDIVGIIRFSSGH